jgi:hypothetical protein
MMSLNYDREKVRYKDFHDFIWIRWSSNFLPNEGNSAIFRVSYEPPHLFGWDMRLWNFNNALGWEGIRSPVDGVGESRMAGACDLST